MLIFLLIGLGGAARLALALGEPIPGFGIQWRKELKLYTVSWMTPTYWDSMTAGVRINDRILCMDGYHPSPTSAVYGLEERYRAIHCPNGGRFYADLFRERFQALGATARIELLVDRDGQLRTIPNVPLTRFTLPMLAEVFFPTFLLGLGLLAVGYVVFRAEPTNELNRVFAFLTLIAGGLALDQTFTVIFTDRLADTRGVVMVLVTPWMPLFGVVFFHLMSLLTDRPALIAFSRLIRRPYYLVSIGFTLLGMVAYLTNDLPVSIPLDWPYLRYVIYSTAFAGGWGIFCLTYTYATTADRRVRNQVGLILLGIISLAICAAPLGAYFLSATPPTRYLNSLPYLALGFVAIAAYAILRYQLFQMRGGILKGLLLVSFCIVLANLIYLVAGARAEFLPILLTALATGLAVGVRRGPTAFFDRLLRREAVDYRIVAGFSQEVGELQEIPRLVSILRQHLRQALDATRVDVWLLDADRQTLDCYLDGQPMRPMALPAGLGEALAAQHAPIAADRPDYRALLKIAPGQHMAAWTPLAEGEQVVGLLGLGPRWTGEIYDEEDRRLLRLLARLAALAILNARQLQRLRAASQMILQAEENERRKIARELHDTILQFLLVLTYGLDELKERSRELARPLDHWQDRISAEAGQLRDLLGYLRAPEMLVQRGLAAALHNWIAGVQDETTVTLRTEFSAAVEDRLSTEAKVAIYRVFREAIHNALKHAHATTIIARLTLTGDRVSLLIQDDGQGFVPAEALRPNAKGYTSLQDMQAYIESVGGRLEIRSTPGAGATVAGYVPIVISPAPPIAAN
jgi:signal transduction histidine kinase